MAGCDKKKSSKHPSLIKSREISQPRRGYELLWEEQAPRMQLGTLLNVQRRRCVKPFLRSNTGNVMAVHWLARDKAANM